MTSQQKNSSSWVNVKNWIIENAHCGQLAVSTTPLDTLSFASPFRQMDKWSLRAWFPQTRIQRLQTFEYHQQYRRPRLPYLPPCQLPPHTQRRLQLVPLDLPPNSPHLCLSVFSNLFFKGIKGDEETTARTIDSLSAWEEMMSLSRMTLFSDIFRNWTRRTWLTGFYYMVD